MTTTECKNQAAEILNQLGGNRFLAMTGSTNLIFDERGNLSMKLKRNNSGANYLKIELNGMDLYNLSFEARRICKKTYQLKRVVKAEYENVYCDQLQEIFKAVTGFYTTL